jgi:hypothetical protein
MRTLPGRWKESYLNRVGAPQNLGEVRAALLSKLGDESKLSILNARIILRTGVNLMQPKLSQINDPQGVSKVLSALRELGFHL